MIHASLAFLVAACCSSVVWAVFLMWYRCNERHIAFVLLPSSTLFFLPGAFAILVGGGLLMKGTFPSSFTDSISHGVVAGFLFGLVWDVCAFGILGKIVFGFEGAERLNRDWYPKMRSFVTGEFIFDLYFRRLSERELIERERFADEIVSKCDTLKVGDLAASLIEVSDNDPDPERTASMRKLAQELREKYVGHFSPDVGADHDRRKLQLDGIRSFVTDMVKRVDLEMRDAFLRRVEARLQWREQRIAETVIVPMPPPGERAEKPAGNARAREDGIQRCRDVIVLRSCPMPGAEGGLLARAHVHLYDGYAAVMSVCRNGDGIVFLDDALAGPTQDSEWGSAGKQAAFLRFLGNGLPVAVTLRVLGLRQPQARLAGSVPGRWQLIEMESREDAEEFVRGLQLVNPEGSMRSDSGEFA